MAGRYSYSNSYERSNVGGGPYYSSRRGYSSSYDTSSSYSPAGSSSFLPTSYYSYGAFPRASLYTLPSSTPRRHYVVCVEHNERRSWRYGDPGLPLF